MGNPAAMGLASRHPRPCPGCCLLCCSIGQCWRRAGRFCVSLHWNRDKSCTDLIHSLKIIKVP